MTDENGMVRRTGSHGELIIWHRTPATSNGSRFEIQDDQSQFENVDATLKSCRRAGDAENTTPNLTRIPLSVRRPV